ncbi:hypothetical protein ABW21_db0204262 [Orbilia brochopaga]|nr:hypothetical protein ABW21_db0204262 [Drechslerella brochopaga]
MRVSPALCERFTPHRRQWVGLGERLQRSFTPSNASISLIEHPATPLGKAAPSYRRFKPASHFSIFKLNELQRSVDNAAAYRLVFFAPMSALKKVKDAVFATGAGTMHRGLYSRCCFQTIGTSQYLPEIGAMASSARNLGRVEVVEEVKCEIVCHGRAQVRDAVRALLHAHPHDAPTYEVIKLEAGFLPSQIALDRSKQVTPTVSNIGNVDPGVRAAQAERRFNSQSPAQWRKPKTRIQYRLILTPPRTETDQPPTETDEQSTEQQTHPEIEQEIGQETKQTQREQDVNDAPVKATQHPPAAPSPQATSQHTPTWLERASQAASQVRSMHTRSRPSVDSMTETRKRDIEGERKFRESLDELLTQIDASEVLGRPTDSEEPAAGTPEPSYVPMMPIDSPPTPEQQARDLALSQLYRPGPAIEAPERFFTRLSAAHRTQPRPRTMREELDRIIEQLEPAKSAHAPPAKKNRHYKRKRTN